MNASSAGGPVEIVEVRDRRTLDRFIDLANTLARDDPNHVPALLSERRAALTASGNPFFRHAEAALWIARRDGADVGRISAQRDRLLDDKEVGHFGLLSAVDDRDVVARLLETAEAWLRARGTVRVQGPFSLSINEETGLLVDGFDTPPMLLMPHDAPYLGAHLAACGYAKAQDVHAYLCDTTAALPPASAAIVARGLPARAKLRRMRKRHLLAEISALVDIFNDGWAGNWGFVPITADEVAHTARALQPLIHERLAWLAELDGEPVAFGLCLPNLNEAIRDLGGRLLPFGWAKLLWRLKVAGVRTGRVPLMGVRRRLHGTFLGRLLPLHIVDALRRESVAMGIRAVEMSWVLEDNAPMCRLAEAIGGHRYKTYRVYERLLAS